MSWQEISTNILIGVGTGLISGYISGILVSSKFNKKEKEEIWKKEFEEDKRIMYRYLDGVQFELNLIGEMLSNNVNVDYTEFRRFLNTPPETPRIIKDKITEPSLKHITGARKLLIKILEDIDSNSLDFRSTKIWESNIIRAKINILSITPK